MPVKLLDFNLRDENGQVYLYWKTENEMNASHFEIERSSDGVSFENIGQVTALNSTATNNYNYNDQHPGTGVSYYRLKQVDADGKWVFSNLLMVNRTASTAVALRPNPFAGHLTITSATTERMIIRIYSAGGQLVLTGSYAPGVQISTSALKPGTYWAVINNKSYKLIKQ